MEMPGRRPQPYFSDFTAAPSVVLGLESPLHKAKSNRELSTSLPVEFSSETNLTRSKSKSQEAGLHRAISAAPDNQFDAQCNYKKEFEELIEQFDILPFKKKYSSITVPVSVKYSTMAYKPRSLKKDELEQEQQKMQDELDQALLLIRDKLGMLTSERVTMEKQMDELTTGITEARIQCHNQCRQRWIAANSGMRRGRSSTYSASVKERKASKTPSPPTSNRNQSNSSGLLSPDSITSNPEFFAKSHKSVGITDSGYGSLNRKSKSAELRTRSTSLTSSTPDVSLSQGSESYGLLNPTIPELPESPCFSQPSPAHKHRERFESTPTLHYNAYTTLRHSRSHSASFTPPLINVTSSPNLSTRRRHDSHPHPPPSHRNSLPESVMNKIVEDEVDFVSVSDSLSQASLSQLSSYNEECSPKSHGSTVIVRRSSLTGQVEHIRRPRKRNSFNDWTDSSPAKDSSPKSSSTVNLTGGDYRVLNTGYKKNRRSSKIILSSSIETTV